MRGRPPNKPSVSGPELARLALSVPGYRELMEETSIGEPMARAVMKVTGMSVAEFVEAQRPQLQRTLNKLLTKIEAEADTLKPSQAAIVYGILHDKHGTEAQRVSQALHIHLKTGDADTALKALFGPAADSISSARASQRNNASRSVDVVEVTATPSQYSGPTALDATAVDAQSTDKRR